MNPTVEGKGYKDGQTYGLALNKQFDGFKPYLAAQYARNSLSVGKKPLLVFKAVEAKHPNTKGINGIAIITGTDVSCFSGTFKAAVQYFHGKNEGAEDKDKLPFSTPEQQDGGIEPPPVLASRFFRFLNLP